MRKINYRFSILNSYILMVGVEAMSYVEKIDVLEMLIGILQDHERKLDEIASRLEALLPEK